MDCYRGGIVDPDLAGFRQSNASRSAVAWRDRIKATKRRQLWRQCQVYVNMTLDSPHGRWQVEHLSHSRHCRSPREAALGEIEWLVIASHWLGGNKCRSLGVEHCVANLKAVEIVRREMMDVEDWIKIARRSVPQSIGASFADSSSSRPQRKGRSLGYPWPACLIGSERLHSTQRPLLRPLLGSWRHSHVQGGQDHS